MHHAEAVGDERVGERGELVGELAADGVVLGRLARVEADVLQQGDLAVPERCDGGLGGLADDVRSRASTGAPSSSPRRAATGASEYLASGAPFGRPRWAVTTTARTGVEQRVQRRERGADAAVVGDGRAVERHVEVGTDEDALAAQVAEAVDGLHGVRQSVRGWT